MKRMTGLCVIPYEACESALKNNEIKIALPNLEMAENLLFCSHKANRENLYEINLFKEKLNIPL